MNEFPPTAAFEFVLTSETEFASTSMVESPLVPVIVLPSTSVIVSTTATVTATTTTITMSSVTSQHSSTTCTELNHIYDISVQKIKEQENQHSSSVINDAQETVISALPQHSSATRKPVKVTSENNSPILYKRLQGAKSPEYKKYYSIRKREDNTTSTSQPNSLNENKTVQKPPTGNRKMHISAPTISSNKNLQASTTAGSSNGNKNLKESMTIIPSNQNKITQGSVQNMREPLTIICLDRDSKLPKIITVKSSNGNNIQEALRAVVIQNATTNVQDIQQKPETVTSEQASSNINESVQQSSSMLQVHSSNSYFENKNKAFQNNSLSTRKGKQNATVLPQQVFLNGNKKLQKHAKMPDGSKNMKRVQDTPKVPIPNKNIKKRKGDKQ
ncbi:hypothetical protein ILUMI_21297 [Ignelater luminosus]|uniref:Uncharacterized protein n=1 Tax=Ignelater luminosus TaxID=2038154 RepID=A0A8K0G407_IGNLU|nr:hypothetical protein ILUMI_21297 [Ignelater luminosus]